MNIFNKTIILLVFCLLVVFDVLFLYGSVRDERPFPIEKELTTRPRLTLQQNLTLEITFEQNSSLEMQQTEMVDSQKLSNNISIFTNTLLDIMAMPQITFDKAYKNPCWIGTKDNGPLNDGKFHCLPYFYLIGVKKSGTSDLYDRISKHPAILTNHGFKEAQWLSRCRFYGILSVKDCNSPKKQALAKKVDMRSLGFYTGMYAPSVAVIRRTSVTGHGKIPNQKIFGDASPDNLHTQIFWNKLPGNEGLTEPKYTNFHYIQHLTPNAKIIIIFRNPVSRLFSDYKYGQVNNILHQPDKMIRKFHVMCVQMINYYKECFRLYSRRHCIYTTVEWSPQAFHKGQNLFTAGFYAFFMEEMYDVFDKKNILPILMTDYKDNMRETLSKVFDFLGLDEPGESFWKYILTQEVQNQSKTKDELKMLNETERLLQEFYKPLNEELAQLLNDSRYLFN